MVRALLLALLLAVLVGCDSLKTAQKTKRDVQTSETIKTQTKRAGDTLRLQVPKVTFRDTTIVKTNYINRTEARIAYDTNGNATVECISAEINELREEIRTLSDTSKEKESTKETSFQSEVILYAFLGLALLIVIVGVAFFWAMSKQSSQILAVLNKIA